MTTELNTNDTLMISKELADELYKRINEVVLEKLILTEEHTRQIAERKCKQLEAENTKLKAELIGYDDQLDKELELEAKCKRYEDALQRAYKDLISGDFDPETMDIVKKLLEQSDDIS